MIATVLLLFALSLPARAAEENPLLAPWPGPHGGVPPFDRIRPEHFEPAFDAATAEWLAELEAIAKQPAKPTFENTIEAIEDAGRTYYRVELVWNAYRVSGSSPELEAVALALAPKQAAFAQKFEAATPGLRERIVAVYESRRTKRLSPEEQRLARISYEQWTSGSGALDPAAKARLGEIDTALATARATFGSNVLADEQSYVVLATEADRAGLPEWYLEGAAAVAAERGLPGQWIVPNTSSAVDPFLTWSPRRELREQVWRAYTGRGDGGGGTDNGAVLAQILALRAERARLFGYPTYAHQHVATLDAGTPEVALELVRSVWPAAVARAREEVVAQQALADADGVTIEPWDFRYYQEKVRKERYDVDLQEVEPYLQLDLIRDAMFWEAGELYGLHFAPASGIPVIHPDVEVWDVTRDGAHVGFLYLDLYARPGKKSIAWVDKYRDHERLAGDVTPLVAQVTNFVRGAPGAPVTISWKDANTMFHEFGHALGLLLSDTTYVSTSGSSGLDHDEVYPLMNERWLETPEVLSRFTRHVETGEPLPPDLLAKLIAARRFNQGWFVTNYLASAAVDLELHMATEPPADPDAFEREMLARMGMPREVEMRERAAQMWLAYAQDSHASGYYGYLWADILAADAITAFVEAGSMYDRETAERFRKYVLAPGTTVDPVEAYRAFRGQDATIDAFLADRGL